MTIRVLLILVLAGLTLVEPYDRTYLSMQGIEQNLETFAKMYVYKI